MNSVMETSTDHVTIKERLCIKWLNDYKYKNTESCFGQQLSLFFVSFHSLRYCDIPFHLRPDTK
jgi:hypothetical protein